MIRKITISMKILLMKKKMLEQFQTNSKILNLKEDQKLKLKVTIRVKRTLRIKITIKEKKSLEEKATKNQCSEKDKLENSECLIN